MFFVDSELTSWQLIKNKNSNTNARRLYCNYKRTFIVNVNTLKHLNGKDSKLVSDIV